MPAKRSFKTLERFNFFYYFFCCFNKRARNNNIYEPFFNKLCAASFEIKKNRELQQ